ncbi:hypothetical protein O181_081037 [Austropuccinia psidii MF-1]|uniref:Uncharacterized protein n=1 Tax=Austropuccinia psidii MF-1 TaxID=1389203 RepID=A0A9Q3FPZ2_9BASI|nr:hypothetical protein [Austropuccinia psidii MF-1]
MSPVSLRDLGFQRHHPEDRVGLSRIKKTWKRTPWTQWWMAIHLGKSYPLCHLHSNSTETSNQSTERIWFKFFSSTNSSKTFFNGAWTTIGSTWHPTGQNLEQVSRRLFSKR